MLPWHSYWMCQFETIGPCRLAKSQQGMDLVNVADVTNVEIHVLNMEDFVCKLNDSNPT